MLPPELTDLTFHDDPAGSDTEVAARTRAAAPGDRIVVFGAVRVGLLRALADDGADVVCVDSARSSLARARDALGDAADRVTLLAEDPRELEIPGGADAVLLPSLAWRAVLLDGDREDILRSVRKSLRPNGVVLVDLEAAPAEAGERDAYRWTVHAEPTPHTKVEHAALPVSVSFASFDASTAAKELTNAGFRSVESASLTPPRSWVVASD